MQPELTPVVLATKLGKADMLMELVKYGANVNVRTQRGQLTPLLMGAILGDHTVVRVLLASLADTEARDTEVGQAGNPAVQMHCCMWGRD